MSRIRTTKQAYEIRLGINSRCIPYLTGGNPEHGYGTGLDYRRANELSAAIRWNPSELMLRASERTKPWTSARYERASNWEEWIKREATAHTSARSATFTQIPATDEVVR
jgi:hypothetical protein